MCLFSGPRRYAFYLISKERYFHKPTYESMTDCLNELAVLCVQLKVPALAMPLIGCGLDKLEVRFYSILFAVLDVMSCTWFTTDVADAVCVCVCVVSLSGRV